MFSAPYSSESRRSAGALPRTATTRSLLGRARQASRSLASKLLGWRARRSKPLSASNTTTIWHGQPIIVHCAKRVGRRYGRSYNRPDHRYDSKGRRLGRRGGGDLAKNCHGSKGVRF